MGGHSRTLWAANNLLQPLRPMAKARSLGPDFRRRFRGYDGDLQMLDSSSIRVHQHAANVKKGAPKKRMPPLGVTLTPAAWGARGAA